MITITPENRAKTHLHPGDQFQLQGDQRKFQALTTTQGCTACAIKTELACLKTPSCFYPERLIFMDITKIASND